MVKSARGRLAYINKCKANLEVTRENIKILRKDLNVNTYKELSKSLSDALEKEEYSAMEQQNFIYNASVALVLNLIEVHFNKQLTQDERQWNIIKTKYKNNLVKRYDIWFEFSEPNTFLESHKEELLWNWNDYRCHFTSYTTYLACVFSQNACLLIPFKLIDDIEGLDKRLENDTDWLVKYADKARAEHTQIKLEKANEQKEKRRKQYEKLKQEFESA